MAMLTDEEIGKYLDGERDPSVIERIERDPEAAAQVAHARRVERALRGQLLRWDCPDAQRLIDFSFEILQQDERATIERHLEYCLSCRSELEELTGFLDDAAPADRPHHNPSRVPADRPRHSASRVPAYLPVERRLERVEAHGEYALRAYRREGDLASLVAAAAGATLFLELERGSSGLLLSGALVTDDPEDQALWTGALVEVRRERELLGAIFVSDAGDFTLEIDSAHGLQVRITRAPDHSLILDPVTLIIPD